MAAIAGQDLEQQVSDALCAWLDANAGVKDVTGRASGNVIPWTDHAVPEYPMVIVKVTNTRTRGGVGRNWDVDVDFWCYASSLAQDSIIDDTDTMAHLRARSLREAVRVAVEGQGTLEVAGLDACPLPGRTQVGRTALQRVSPDYTAFAVLSTTLWVTL